MPPLAHPVSGPRTSGARRIVGIFFVILLIALIFLRWGGTWLVAADTLPAHVDEAVVLQGSILGEKARINGAVQLLNSDIATGLLISVPKESYWGEPVAPIAREYIGRLYGPELADRIDFCQTGPEVNSTEQEAGALVRCIREHGWKSIAVVTSSYHTRRARIIWNKLIREQNLPVSLYVHGVADPEFKARGWWSERLSAKTWFGEFTKLVWTVIFGA